MANSNRDEFKWNSIQERQIDLLRDMNSSLSKSVSRSDSMNRLLSKSEILLKSVLESTTRTAASVDALYSGIAGESRYDKFTKSVEAKTQEMMKAVQQRWATTIDSTGETVEDTMKSLADAEKKRAKKKEEEDEETQEKLKSAWSSLLSKLRDSVDKLGGKINDISDNTNKLIQSTGESLKDIQATRKDIYDTVSEINNTTGLYFNNATAYAKMIEIAKSANIGDLEVLEDITRPILLASEGLDVSTDSIASILTKWSTRYTFSSLMMEDMVNELVTNTAGNNASAEATVRNIKSLEGWISYYAKGDEDKTAEMVSSLSKATSWLESMGVDTERYTGYVKSIASGEALTDSNLIQLLNAAGLSVTDAQNMFESGQGIEKLFEALFTGDASIMGDLTDRDISVLKQVAEARGLDLESMLDSYNAYKSSNYTSLSEFNPTPTTAEEVIENKYVSFMDKTENWLSRIHKLIATAQETVGFGLSDIAGIYVLAKGIIGPLKTILGSTGILTKLGSALGIGGAHAATGGVATSILGGLSGLLPIVLPIAALAGTAAFIYTAVKDIRASNEKNFEDLIGATKKNSSDSDQMLMMTEKLSTDDKGNVVATYSMDKVSASDFNAETHLANLEKSRKQTLKDRGIVQTIWESMIGATAADDQYDLNKSWTSFYNGLSSEDRKLVNAYATSGLLANDNQMSFMIKNFGKIKDLHNQGYAVQLSATGINSPYSSQELIGYDTGTNYISHDQVAYLHEGEAVVPKKYNPSANLTELEALRDRVRAQQSAEDSETQGYIRETATILSDIKDFLSEWKADNIKRETINKASSKFAANSRYLSSYLLEG